LINYNYNILKICNLSKFHKRLSQKILKHLELRNTKIYGLFEQKHLEDKEVLRPDNLNFCIS